MKLWEFVLAADKKLDLSKAKQARDWLASQPWGQPVSASLTLPVWVLNLSALRSIARRLKGKTTARPSGRLTDAQADTVAAQSLAKLSAWAERTPAGKPLSKTTYRGVRLYPTYLARDRMDAQGKPARIVAAQEWKAGFPNSEVFWWDDGSLYWQLVFLSLLEDSGPAICKTCGAMLGNVTPTGHKSKTSLCKKCLWKNWYAKQSTEQKRKRWNEYYKENRSKNYKGD